MELATCRQLRGRSAFVNGHTRKAVFCKNLTYGLDDLLKHLIRVFISQKLSSDFKHIF